MPLEKGKKHTGGSGIKQEYGNLTAAEHGIFYAVLPGILTLMDPDIEDPVSLLIEAKEENQADVLREMEEILQNPGKMSQKEEGKALAGIILRLCAPFTRLAMTLKTDSEYELYGKETLSVSEQERLKNSIVPLFPGAQSCYISAALADEIRPLAPVINRAIDRYLEQLGPGKEVVQHVFYHFGSTLKVFEKGVMSAHVYAADPLTYPPEANYTDPLPSADREKDPIQEGETSKFTLDEMYEKAEAFPLHKALNSQYRLKELWTDVYLAKEKGELTPEKNQEFWREIDACYRNIEDTINGLVEKQKDDPTFADRNMRICLGFGSAKKSFEDVVSGDRGIAQRMSFLPSRREAVEKGWPLDTLGTYENMRRESQEAGKYLENIRAAGPVAKEYADSLQELKQFIDTSVMGQPYEQDPEKRAKLFAKCGSLIDRVLRQADQLSVAAETLNDKKVRKSLSDSLTKSCNYLNAATQSAELGVLPLLHQTETLRREAELASAKENLQGYPERVQGRMKPEQYAYLSNYVNEVKGLHPDSRVIDLSFVEESRILDRRNAVQRELRSYENGTELTLQGRAGMDRIDAVSAFDRMLTASDSLFHFDSAQFKAVRENLKKASNGTATGEDMEKLTQDVKNWLTDPNYDRIHKHGKNEFDNTRFNIMFALANELDPVWAKENFNGMNIAGLPGEKAANTSFHNVEDYMNFLHSQMAERGFLPDSRVFDGQAWKETGYSYGQKGLVEEILRNYEDPSYTEEEQLKAEIANLNTLSEKNPKLFDKFKSVRIYMGAAGVKVDRDYYNIEELRNDLLDGIKDESKEGNAKKLKEGKDKKPKKENAKKPMEGNVNDLTDGIDNRLKNIREKAVKELDTYLRDEANRKDPDYKKAVAVLAVMDPVKAHNFIAELRKNADLKKDKLVQGLNLMDLEKQEGLDLGGRKARREKAAGNGNQVQKKQSKPRPEI